MKVKYTGTADFQVFSAKDFEKAGVEGKKTTFPRNEPVEVDDAVGEALLASDGLFGNHSFESADEEDEEGTPRADADNVDADDPEMTESGSVSQSEGTGGAGTARAASRSRAARGGKTTGSPATPA